MLKAFRNEVSVEVHAENTITSMVVDSLNVTANSGGKTNFLADYATRKTLDELMASIAGIWTTGYVDG